MAEILTDEQAAAIWSGQTTSLLDLGESKKNETPPIILPKIEETVKVEEPKVVVKDEEINFIPDEEEEEEAVATTSGKKGGRKPTDLVNMVNQLIADDTLLGWQDKDGNNMEIKTIDEAKQLIRDNLSNKDVDKEEEWWEAKKGAYSPQVQAILHYADQGAQSATQLAQLLGAIQEVEEAVEIDLKTPAGQEATIRQTLKSKGFKDSYIDKQITILKDLGDDRLKEEAEELYPELVTARQKQVQQRIADQESRRKEAEDASKVYVSTIKKTLDKDTVGGVKLTRDDKAKLYEAVTKPAYTSLNGAPTNLFVKTLEEMQFGKNADYDHFMNIVQYAIDPKGFLEKLKTSVGNEIADHTYRQLKTAKSSSANTNNDDVSRQAIPNKKGITKGGGFVNPYA